MPKLPALLISLLLGAALAACGAGQGAGLLPPDRADRLLGDIDRVERLAAEGRCEEAERAARLLIDDAEEPGPEVDRRLREALSDGAARLKLLLEEPGGCEAATETATVPTETAPLPPVPPETAPEEPGKEKKEKQGKEEEGEEGEPPAETEPPGSPGGGLTTPETPESSPPPGQGGVPPGQGGVPPGQGGGAVGPEE